MKMSDLNAEKAESENEEDFSCAQMLPDDCDVIVPATPFTPKPLPSWLVPSSIESSMRGKSTCDDYFGSRRKNLIIQTAHKYCSAPEPIQRAFDKDISWCSSMESISGECQREELNTVEKATFFPDPKICEDNKIQRRALWHHSSTESLDFKPLDNSFERTPDSYERQTRVSDVCSVFQSLNVVMPCSKYQKNEQEDRFDFDTGCSFLATPISSPFVTKCPSPDGTTLHDVKEQNPKLCPATPDVFSKSSCRSPSVFSPMAKDISTTPTARPSSSAVTPKTNEEHDESELDITLKHCPFDSLLVPDQATQKSLDKPTEDLKHIDKKIISDDFISKFMKPSSFGANVKFLEQDETELFSDLIELENLSNQCKVTKPNKKLPKLPENDGFLSSTAYSQLFPEEVGESSKKVVESISKLPKSSSVSSKPATFLHPPPVPVAKNAQEDNIVNVLSTSCPETSRSLPCRAKKRLRLEKSPWESSSLIENSQVGITDTEMFQVADSIEATLNVPDISPFRHPMKRRKVEMRCGENASFFPEVTESLGTSGKDILGIDELEMVKGAVQSKMVHLPFESKTDKFLRDESAFSRNLCNEFAESAHESTVLSKTADTEFIGFKTAKNTKISVSNEALARAKARLEEDFPESTIKESNCLTTEVGDTGNTSSVSTAHLTRTDFVGFKTAGNKSIHVSEAALQKAKARLDEDLESSNTGILRPKACLEDLSGGFVGFKTANNMTVSVSTEALEKAKTRLQDADFSAPVSNDERDLSLLTELPVFKTSSWESTQKAKTCQAEGLTSMSVGFKTASHREVEVSKQSLVAAKSLFNEEEADFSGFIGFKTANNTTVPVSEKAFARAKERLEDITDNHFSTSDFVGFRTANNTVISVTETALAKARDRLDDLVDDDFSMKNFVGFQTANNTVVSVSKESLARAKTRLEDVSRNDISIPDFMGFKTANNTAVSVSNEALTMAKARLEDIAQNDIIGFKTANNTAVSVSNESLQLAKASMEDTSSAGFKTANETDVSISKQALLKARSFLDDETITNDFCDIAQNDFIGFKTANNTAVSVSNESLLLAKARMEDSSNAGFKTANETDVSISKQALLKARSLFDDETITNEFTGFLTAKNTAVPVSKAAMLNARKRLEEDIAMDVTEGKPAQEDNASNSVKKGKSCSEVLPIMEALSVSQKENVNPCAPRTSESQESKKVLSKNESLNEPSILEKSDSDATILPAWVIAEMTDNDLVEADFANISLKRSMTSPLRSDNKRVRLDSMCKIRELRAIARRDQEAIAQSKANVKPIEGLMLQKRKCEKCLKWREVLPDGPSDSDENVGVSEKVLGLTFENAQDFRFNGVDYLGSEILDNTEGIEVGDHFKLILDDDDQIGAEEFERAFLAGPGIAPNLVPTGWVRHHYGLIVWKLAAYQRNCPNVLSEALTPHNVMLQLKYRYDREIDRCNSSALKRIFEKDDTAAKPIVFVVVKVTQSLDSCELLLSDGWYTCPARCDMAMERIVRRGKVKVGTKLMTIGAEIVGCDDAVPPLEKPSSASLKISTNSTRRVRWDLKLGFRRLSQLPAISISSILTNGGNISCLRLAVVRVYPLVFMEKRPDGRNVTRNEKSEERAMLAFQRQQERDLENIRKEVQEMMKAETPGSSETPHLAFDSQDPCAFEGLSNSAKERITSHIEAQRELVNATLQKRMAEAKKTRNVRSVLRLRVVDLDGNKQISAVISWWQPSSDLVAGFIEGTAYTFYNLTPSNTSSQQLYLNSSRLTTAETLPPPENPLPLRSVTSFGDIFNCWTPPFSELDIAGLVVGKIGSTVYLTDDASGESFIGILFFKGLEEYACEHILFDGTIVGVSNVQWRQSSSREAIPLGYVTETTLFTLNSKSAAMQRAMENVKREMNGIDIPAFTEQCLDTITTKIHQAKSRAICGSKSLNISANDKSMNQSPSRFASSPAPNQLRLSEPNASSTPIRSACQKRIGILLKNYGDLPPLSPIEAAGSARKMCTRAGLSKKRL